MRGSGQLNLPFERDPAQIRDYLERAAGADISLALTDNSVTMLTAKKKGKTLSIRLHRIFLRAEKDVIKEVALFITKRKAETPLLRRFIRENLNSIGKNSRRRVVVKKEGRHHDLGAIFRALNSEYFEGRISCDITWGNRCPRHAVKKRTLGSYSRSGGIIRINPLLDARRVPRYFIEFVVYHEMLHADMDTSERHGRRAVHSKEFKERERLFKHYQKALMWEKKEFR